MLVCLPIPHDQGEDLAGRRALVQKGEDDKVGQLGDAAALAPQDHEMADQEIGRRPVGLGPCHHLRRVVTVSDGGSTYSARRRSQSEHFTISMRSVSSLLRSMECRLPSQLRHGVDVRLDDGEADCYASSRRLA